MAKRKDAPSSVVTRSSKATSTAIQASTNPLNTRKSPRFEKQIQPTPSTVKKKPEKNDKQMGLTPSTVKKKPEKSEKQMGSTPLRRSTRGKNPVDVPTLNVKSTEKSADISEESAENVAEEKEDEIQDSKKRKRYNALEFKARNKPQRVRVETEDSEVLAHIESPSSSESSSSSESPSSSGDQFWSVDGTPVANETADGNADSLYQHLKPTVSELCNILKFSEGAQIIVERFLKFVVGNFNVSKEHTSILQALMISVCWICSSLLKHTIDRKETFALATTHLNFSCEEEEADQVYEKLKEPKEMFLQNPMNVKVLNAFKDRASRPEEPRMSPAAPPIPQEQERENHGSSNEEALQSSGQILEEDIARKERNEVDKFDREWNEKKMNIVNDFELEKTLIRYLYSSNSSIRSEKLSLVEKEFADALNKHEKLRQVVVNDEISLNGPAKEDQESREMALALLGDPVEAENHDKPVHGTCRVVVPDEVVNLRDSSNDMVSGSHTSEKQMANATVLSKPTGEVPAKQDADTVNDVAVADATVLNEPIGDIPAIEVIASEQQDEVENVASGDDATALSEPIGDISAKQDANMENDVAGADATVLGEPIENIPDIEENASEQDDEVGNVVSGDDAMALSEPVGDIPAKQHADMEIDVAGQAECLEMEVPQVHFNKENDIGEDTSSSDGSHAGEARIETRQNYLTPHVDLVEMEIPAINNLGPHAVEDPSGTGSNDVVLHAEAPVVGTPVGHSIASNVNSMDEPSTVLDPNATGPNDIASILADNDTVPHVGSSTDGSNAGEDGNETTPNDVALRVDPCEMIISAVNDVAPNVDSAGGSRAVQDPPNETGLYGMSLHVDSNETGMPADIDMSHAVEDPSRNGSKDISLHADSDQMAIPAANDLTPHIEYADVSHAVEDSNGTGPNHVAPNIESAAVPADNCNQDKAHDIMQPVEAIQVDQIIPEDASLSPHAEPSSVMSTEPTITENQAATPSTSEVLAQTTAPPITAQAQIQLEQYMLDLQRNANSNQAGSRKTRRVDPLHIELEQLSSVKEKMVKSYHENIQKMNMDCEKEIRKVIAEIRLKYCNKRQEADATFNSQKKEVENSMNTVVINQVLAATFRLKCQDVSHGCAAVLQACQAESMRQQSRFPGSSTCLPGQSSGGEQTPPPPPPPPPPPIPATAVATPPPQTQPPLQIVHQPSDLFLTPLTRHPHTTNPRPTDTTSIRPPPPTDVSSRPPTIANLTVPSTATNRPPPMINPITPPTPTIANRPLATSTPIAPSATPSTIRSPHGMNPLTSSTTPIRPPLRLNPFGVSAATSRPWVSSVMRSIAPHMRPSVGREFRTPGPHMRPPNPTSSSGLTGSRTYPRILLAHHVTSSLPLTSPSNSQPPNSTSSAQPLPPPPQPRSESPQPPPPSQLPHASATISARSSLPCDPQDKLNDKANALSDNAAQPPAPSAHEVVYLSDDD